jgi:hypothetical protein
MIGEPESSPWFYDLDVTMGDIYEEGMLESAYGFDLVDIGQFWSPLDFYNSEKISEDFFPPEKIGWMSRVESPQPWRYSR